MLKNVQNLTNNIMFACGGCKKNRKKGVPRKPVDTKYIGKNCVIAGYSVRAINQSAKACNMSTLTVDCFADMDLRRVADAFVHVNLDRYKDDNGKLEKPAAAYIEEELMKHEEMLDKADFILVGSGFENHPKYLQSIAKNDAYTGNGLSSIEKVRKVDSILPFLKKHDILFPNTVTFHLSKSSPENLHIDNLFVNSKTNPRDLKAMENGAKTSEFIFNNYLVDLLEAPFVLKSAKTGGGFSMYKINTVDEFREATIKISDVKKGPLVAQEYIHGDAMSCSFISTGSKAKPIAYTKQIIGEKRFGCKNDFAYCGNIMNPEISDVNHDDNKELTDSIQRIIDLIVEDSKLVGSNGLDFVLRNGKQEHPEIYFLEINTRFQGTLDLIEAVTGQNVVEMHIESIRSKTLPDDLKFPDQDTYLKAIYYSPLDFYIMVDLNNLEYNDAPLIGNFLQEGEPICSSIVQGVNEEEAFEKGLDDRDLITRVQSLESRIDEDSAFLRR